MFAQMRTSFLAVPLALAAVSHAFAADRDQGQRSNAQPRQQANPRADQAARDQAQPAQPPAFQSQLLQANQLIGLKVENAQKEDLGRIEQIILDEGQNRVQYVVLSFGGWAGLGDKLFAVPFQAFQFSPGKPHAIRPSERGVAVLDIPRDRLKNAPGFDKHRYPDVANPQFAQSVETFYSTNQQADQNNANANARAERKGEADRNANRDRDNDRSNRRFSLNRLIGREREPGNWSQDRAQWRLRALTKVVGSTVEDPQGYNIADIEDIVVEQREGRLVYAILSYGGALNVGEKYAVVPWQAIRPGAPNGKYALNVSKDQARQMLDAVAYTRDTDLSNAQFARNVHQRFNTQPYWEVYGYGPAGDASVGWRAQDEFIRAYKPDQTQQIQGAIQSVGTYYPSRNAAPGLRLRVQTDDGKTVTVFAGPQSYAQHKGMAFYTGDKVTIVGSKSTIEGRNGIIAREIRSGDKTLILFNEQGRPAWNPQDLSRESTSHYLEYRGSEDRSDRSSSDQSDNAKDRSNSGSERNE